MERAIVSLTFDDGLRCQFERAVPILHNFDLPATFFLVANTSPVHIDWGQHDPWPKLTWSRGDIQVLKAFVQRGYEIGSHSVWHLNPGFPDFDPQFEATRSKQLIEGWLEQEISSFCYPFCRKPDTLKKAVADSGYKQARAGATAAYYSQPPTDWFDVDCREVGRIENEKQEVNSWVRLGCWHILMYHAIGTKKDGYDPVAVPEFNRQIAELAKLRDSGAVEVLTFKDAADRMRAAATGQRERV